MAILLDSSAVLAAADQSDLNHRAAVAWFGRVNEPMLIGALTLCEVDLLLQRELSLKATLSILEAIASGAIRVVAPTQADFADHRGFDPRDRADARNDRVSAEAHRRGSGGHRRAVGCDPRGRLRSPANRHLPPEARSGPGHGAVTNPVAMRWVATARGNPAASRIDPQAGSRS